MKNTEIDKILKKQTNTLYGKGVSAKDYHKVILPIIFIKFLTSKVEEDWKEFARKEGIDPTENNYQNYLDEAEMNDSFISIDWEFLWSNIKSTSSDNIKQKLDGVFKSLEKFTPEYKDMSIYSYVTSDLPNSNLMSQIEYIENNYEYDKTESIDLFGYIYEHFLEKYNVLQGRGGEFYTPHTIVKMMASITEDRIDKNNDEVLIYDPTMGTGGMLTQSLNFLINKGFKKEQLKFFGQEITKETWNMSRMNFILRTQSWSFGPKAEDTFLNDLHKNKMFDVILSNPPFNLPFTKEEYGHLVTDDRFSKYGIAFGDGKANYNFFTHIVSHLSDVGVAAVVMQPAACQSSNNDEIAIRKKYIQDNLIEAIIRLPQNIFENASIGANIWVFNKSKKRKDILLVDLEKETKKEKTLQIIPDDVIYKITKLFNAFNQTQDTSIESDLKYAIVDNETILSDHEVKINISQYIKVEEQVITINTKDLAEQVKSLKTEITKSLKELDTIIDYLIKE